jgi:RNA polymerase sigma-70 factor (ECF subfamily)
VVPAARKVVTGRRRIVRLFIVVARKFSGRLTQSILPINSELGLATYLDGMPFLVTSFETDGRSILALYNILNPEKLRGIRPLNGTPD